MDATQLASAHQAEQAALARQIAGETAALWRSLNPTNLDLSWAVASGQAYALVAGAQFLAASTADMYTTAVLDAQGIDPQASGTVQANQFAGVASDGRALESLLYQPVIATKAAIGSGASVPEALTGGLALLDMIVRTQIADAGRAAAGTALTSRAAATGYVRMVVGKTCSRCIVLAGRWYRWNAGFARHP